MCSYHWGMVPVPMQRTVVKLYNSGKPLAGHTEAVVNAVRQVQDRINLPELDPFRVAWRDS